MKLYDISVPIAVDLPVYPGDPRVEIEPVTMLAWGDTANVSRLTISSHCGTHVDPPRHYSDHGLSVDRLPLSLLVGQALVADMNDLREIGRASLAPLAMAGEERLLLKTTNSRLWAETGFCGDFAHLTPDGAAYLVEMGIKLVGIDYLSIERSDGTGEVHRLLLDNGVVILEGLNLDGVAAGRYELICLPLKISGGDGAPARALLRSPERAEERAELDLHTTRWPLS